MKNFGHIPNNTQCPDRTPTTEFGQTEESQQNKACCLNETIRFDITLVYEDFTVVKTAYMFNYAAYLKCQKKCPPNSFTTSDADANAPKGGSGEVSIWAAKKESQRCVDCVPGALKKAFQVENCRHKGTLGRVGGVGVPPPTQDEILMIEEFIHLMSTGGSEAQISTMMDNWVAKYCNKAKCTPELKLLCRTVKK